MHISVQMLHLQPDRLTPHMSDIIEYMLQSTQACHFIYCVNLMAHFVHGSRGRSRGVLFHFKASIL